MFCYRRNRVQSPARTSKTNVTSEPETTCNHECCKRCIFVRAVSHTMSVPQLSDFFEKFGPVKSSRIIYHHKSKKHTGQAKIEFINVDDAQNALKRPKSEYFYGGRYMKPCISRCQKPGATEKSLIKPETLTKRPDKVVVRVAKDPARDNLCYFDRLPDELINYIFSYLNFQDRIRLEQVCKRWQYLNTQVAWVDMRVLKFTSLRRTMKSSSLEATLKRCGSTLREIDFSTCRHRLTLEFPLAIAKYCPNLVSVNFTKTPINVKSMKNISENCKNLTTINLQAKKSVVEKSVVWILKNGNIQHLDLSNNRKITGNCLRLVTNSMKTLILNGCAKLLPSGLDHLKNCSGITDLRLSNCKELTSDSLVAVIKSLQPSLTDLHLGGTFLNCDKNGFLQILKHCKNLKRLNLENNPRVDVEVISLLSRKCLQLRYLNLNGNRVTDEGLIRIAALPHLRDLCINYVRDVTDKGISELSQVGVLESLEMRGLSSIGDTSCVALLIHCKDLQYLDISSCVDVTDVVVVEAIHIRRSEDVKLKIIAGGTSIANFVENSYLEVSNVNNCPTHMHPYFGEFDPLDMVYSDSDDDHGDFDDYDEFIDPDEDDFHYELINLDALAF